MRKPIAIVVLVGASLLPGCAAVVAGAAAGAGTYAYVTGELKGTLEAPMDAAGKATRRGLEDLHFFGVEEKHDAMVGEAKAKMADDTKVSVSLRRITDSTTEIRIRVGVLGSETKSIEILDAIKKRV